MAGREALHWLIELGVEPEEMSYLNPCVPGEFTLPDTLYVNTATPRIIYMGTEEGTLPLVTGLWYLIPVDVVARHPDLAQKTRPVSTAPRLAAG